MALIKHIAIKNVSYSDALAYLKFEHDEFTNKPILDENGEMIRRQFVMLEGINCTPETYGSECTRLNRQYGKNNSREEIKAHHYIISFDPRDKEDNGLTPQRAQELGMEFARRHFPGHQIIVCTHTDGHNKAGNIHVHKMKRGEYIGGHVPFGLRKHPSIKNKLELDPEAAGIVRHVFELAINGMKTAEIAAQLNEEEVVTPGAYFQKTHPDTRKFRNTTEQMSWNSTMVLKILQQEMYYGAVVGHKRKGTEVGWKHSIAVPKDEQVIVEGMHESIVTKEEFLKANEVVRKMKSPSSRIARDYPLRTVARCAGCGRALQYYPRLKRPYYLCNSSKYAVETVCCQEKMYEDVINEAVWQALQSLFALSNELSGRLKKKKAALGNDQEAYRLSIAEMQRKLTKLNTDKFANMDRYMSGEMDKTVYLKLRSEMDQQIASLSESITALERKLQAVQAEASDEASTVLANIKKYAGEKQLTNEMVLAFIKKVLITDGEHIEIQWNFSDVFLQYLKTE